MPTNSDAPGTSGENAAAPQAKGRTRRSLIGLGAVLGGAVIGTMVGASQSLAARPCFLRGTLIRTPEGDRAVEDLRVGDLVSTSSGGSRPVKWIGRRSYAKAEGRRPWVADIVPVRIERGAIDGRLPERDLYLSQAHALYLDGALIPAVNLVGTPGITLAAPADLNRIDYLHVELATHDVIFAEGLPAETYLDDGENREGFDNFIEFERLYGEPAARKQPSFAPILSFNGGRSRARSFIRSAISPWIDRRTQLDRIRDRLIERSGR